MMSNYKKLRNDIDQYVSTSEALIEGLDKENALYAKLADLLQKNNNLLQTEKEQLKAKSAAIDKAWDKRCKRIEAANEQLKKERDAAVDCIKRSHIIGYADNNSPIYSPSLCMYCSKNAEVDCDCSTGVGEKFMFSGLTSDDKNLAMSIKENDEDE